MLICSLCKREITPDRPGSKVKLSGYYTQEPVWICDGCYNRWTSTTTGFYQG